MRFVPGPGPARPAAGSSASTASATPTLTGRGTFRTRATARIEKVTPRRKGIVVTELPYLVGPEKVIEKIKDLGPGQEAAGHLRRQGPHRPQARPAAGHRGQERLQPRGRARAALPADADGGLLRHQQRRPGRRPAAHAGPEGAAAGLRRPPPRRRAPAHRVPADASARTGCTSSRACSSRSSTSTRSSRSSATSDDAGEAKARLIDVFDLSDAQADYILDMPLRRLTKFSPARAREREGRAASARSPSSRRSSATRSCCAGPSPTSSPTSPRRTARRGARCCSSRPAAPATRRDAARGGRRPVLGAAVLDRPAGPHRRPPTRCPRDGARSQARRRRRRRAAPPPAARSALVTSRGPAGPAVGARPADAAADRRLRPSLSGGAPAGRVTSTCPRARSR